MSYDNLIEVAKFLDQFEHESEHEFSMENFAFWLSNKLATKPRTAEYKTDSKEAFVQQSADVQISILIGRMYKYARMYSKKILISTQLNGLDDYTFMATLMFRESMTKSELIHYNLMESVTSGSDIIKRLIKSGYIEEFDDHNDRRSKRVRITESGKILMFQVFNEMDLVSDIITGDLNNDDKLFLLSNLKKLESFHNDIYNKDRKSALILIKEKYLDNTE